MKSSTEVTQGSKVIWGSRIQAWPVGLPGIDLLELSSYLCLVYQHRYLSMPGETSIDIPLLSFSLPFFLLLLLQTKPLLTCNSRTTVPLGLGVGTRVAPTPRKCYSKCQVQRSKVVRTRFFFVCREKNAPILQW